MPSIPTERLNAPPAALDAPDTRHATTIRARIAEGMASANAGRLVDGEAVFARIRAELNERERPRHD